jgi:polysaccharide export outer membrane protein
MKVTALAILALSFAPSSLLAQTAAPPTPASLSSGLATQPPVDTALLEQLLNAKRPLLTFKPDDILTVQIFGIENYAVKQRVADDGTIIFPLIGSLQVAGLTTEQLQASIAKALAAGGMVMHAQVSVVADSRPSEVVSVLGDVVHPGIFPATGNSTLANYISQAQGFVESVSGAQASSEANYTVVLIRPTLDAPVRIPLSTDIADAQWGRIPVFSGDQIWVDKVGLVYAVGAFKLQGSYQLKNTTKTTVTELVALAGGIGFEGDAKEAHIVRRENGQTTVLNLNVTRILRGQDPDFTLQAEDILFVPTNQLKAAIKGGGPSIIVSLASAALYSR